MIIERKWCLVDRDGWAQGEWDNECDEIKWTDQETGYLCEAIRQTSGAWCGYVSIPLTHKKLSEPCNCCNMYHWLEKTEVHGGVTFSRLNDDKSLFIIGFDCMHYGDKIPNYRISAIYSENYVYRDEKFVIKEVTNLAKKLKELENE